MIEQDVIPEELQNYVISLIENDMKKHKKHNKAFTWDLVYSTEQELRLSIKLREQLKPGENNWQWYKNLVIPTSILKQSNSQAQNTDLYVGFMCIKKQKDDTFGTVEIIGNKNLKVEIGQKIENLKFKGLKFGETTYQSKCNNFVILIFVYKIKKNEIKQENQSQCVNNTQYEVLNVYSSPKIYVEARKKTWVDRGQQENQNLEIFEPFKYEQLMKVYKIKDKNTNQDITINKDLNHLNNYFISPSIRNKSRHPFFLLLRFPDAVSLYYKKSICDQQPLKKVFKCVQEEICKYVCNQLNNQQESKPIILQLKHQRNQDGSINKKQTDEYQSSISSVLIHLDSTACQYQYLKKDLNQKIDSSYQELIYNDELLQIYKESYPDLYQIYQENVDKIKELNSYENSDNSNNQQLSSSSQALKNEDSLQQINEKRKSNMDSISNFEKAPNKQFQQNGLSTIIGNRNKSK